jgi:acetaldehyde dehydrogenase
VPEPLRVVIIGSGNIGTDLMAKIERSTALELVGVAGIDAASAGLARAAKAGVPISSEGLLPLLGRIEEVDLAFDATSASAHAEHARILADRGIRSVDLTPAGLGPAVVPVVNLHEQRDAPDVNLVTCGAQATVPIVAAIADATALPYAETVSSISARSAGPGTRANIDEFTQSTGRALELLGGARRGKAIIILNPADPPVLMRNAIYAEVPEAAGPEVVAAVERAVAVVAAYVPGYRLSAEPALHDGVLTVLVEVEGAGDHLPRYAGNLDIMTSAAVRVAEVHASREVAA